MERQVQVLERSPQLAGVVKTLSVRFLRREWQRILAVQATLEAGLKLSAPRQQGQRSLSCVFGALPQLTTLQLDGLTSAALTCQIQPGLVKGHDPPSPTAIPIAPEPRVLKDTLRVLDLIDCNLTGADLQSLLRLLGSALTDLHICVTTLIKRTWRDVVDSIRQLLTQLVRLELKSLCGTRIERPASMNEVSFTVSGETVSRTFRGHHGVEAVVLRDEFAHMRGAEAVRMGFGLMEEGLRIHAAEVGGLD
ncbi:hypothetical protein LTR53_014152 [Teratosphaeriaceae sp. CCFEE 6253]|nr:hypothetical protein LTR53_014152 [Teratosphaeriaceae sp. CCFEE 6253]